MTSVDKANVLESSRLWREVVQEVARQYPDVTVEHMFVDSAAMKLIQNPKSLPCICKNSGYENDKLYYSIVRPNSGK